MSPFHQLNLSSLFLMTVLLLNLEIVYNPENADLKALQQFIADKKLSEKYSTGLFLKMEKRPRNDYNRRNELLKMFFHHKLEESEAQGLNPTQYSFSKGPIVNYFEATDFAI